jgi:hypothetical protein
MRISAIHGIVKVQHGIQNGWEETKERFRNAEAKIKADRGK